MIHDPAQSLRSPPPAAPPPDELQIAADRLRREIDQTIQSAKRALYVRREVLTLSLFDLGFGAGTVAIAGAGAIALAIAAALLLVNGVRRGMAQWTHDAWWSDVAVATAIAAAVALVAWSVKRRMHKAVLARTRARLETPPTPAPGNAP